MGDIVYIDLFFLINFSMDFLCLYLTAKLLCERISVARFLLAAAFGGVYACVALFLPFEGLGALFCDMLACATMSVIAFLCRKGLKRIPVPALTFTAISIVLGGFMTALFNLFNRVGLSELFSGEAGPEDSISAWLVLALAVVGGIFTKLCSSFFRGRSMRTFADVEVSVENKKAKLYAMADSGNLLREPISGKPCIVAEVDRLSGILPPEISSAARSGKPLGAGVIPERFARRICLIPARTAGGGGMLVGLRADRVVVRTDSGEREVDAVIALCRLDGEREALIPSELLI